MKSKMVEPYCFLADALDLDHLRKDESGGGEGGNEGGNEGGGGGS